MQKGAPMAMHIILRSVPIFLLQGVKNTYSGNSPSSVQLALQSMPEGQTILGTEKAIIGSSPNEIEAQFHCDIQFQRLR